MDNKIDRQSYTSSGDQPTLASNGEGVRVVAMCNFEAVQDYELGFRQFDVLTAVAKAEEDPTWWVGQIGGKIGLFPSECVEILKGYPDRLPLFKIFLSDDDAADSSINESAGIGLTSSDDVPVCKDKHVSPSASTSSIVSSSSSEFDISSRQRASTEPDVDVAIVPCYRCKTNVRIRRDQCFYPCACGANVKRPDPEDDLPSEATPNSGSGLPANAITGTAIVATSAAVGKTTKKRRNTTASASPAAAVVVREGETPKQRKKREKRERELRKRQEEEDRKFRERRDKGRPLSPSQWNRQVDSARERLWRASLVVAGPGGLDGTDASSSNVATDDTLSMTGSSVFDVDTFEDARSDSPRDLSSFASALSSTGSSNTTRLTRSGSMSSLGSQTLAAKNSKKKKEEKKEQKEKKKEERRREKEERKRAKAEERERRKAAASLASSSGGGGGILKRRNSLFGSSGSVVTRRHRDKLDVNNHNNSSNGGDDHGASDEHAVKVTINPITERAKRQQREMKAKTLVRTRSGRVMTLDEVEREGKKSNWDVSRLFSVRVRGGHQGPAGLSGKQQRKAAAAAAAELEQQREQKEREQLQEAARQLEEERKRFAEERERFEAERLRVMLLLAQDMEGVKLARDGAPLFPSPAGHPLLQQQQPPQPQQPQQQQLQPQQQHQQLVTTEPSPVPSFAASQSSFSCLPSMLGPLGSLSASTLPAPPPSSDGTHWPGHDDDDSVDNEKDDDNDEEESKAKEPAAVSPRKPPSGGVFLPFLMAPRPGAAAPAKPAEDKKSMEKEDEEKEAALLDEERLLDQLKRPDGEKKKKTMPRAEDSDSEEEREEERTDDEGDSDDEDEVLNENAKMAADKRRRWEQQRKITVAPIEGIDQLHARPLDAVATASAGPSTPGGSWTTAISPRQRALQQQVFDDEEDSSEEEYEEEEKKDVIVRPALEDDEEEKMEDTSSAKKVSFVGTAGSGVWTSAESPRRKLEALRAQGASQADIKRERKRLAAAAAPPATTKPATATSSTANTATAAEIEQLLDKMKQLYGGERSSGDDSWTSTESSADDDDEEDDDEEEEEEEETIPEWKRGPPRSLQEMREYKEFVRARYEAEKRATERHLRQQQQQRARGATVATSSPAAAATKMVSHNNDQRVSWII